jgi:hypothetical protein
VAGQLRGMPTIVRQSFHLGQCSLLGELIEDTATRYYYRRRLGENWRLLRNDLRQFTSCRAKPARTGVQTQTVSAAGAFVSGRIERTRADAPTKDRRDPP